MALVPFLSSGALLRCLTSPSDASALASSGSPPGLGGGEEGGGKPSPLLGGLLKALGSASVDTRKAGVLCLAECYGACGQALLPLVAARGRLSPAQLKLLTIYVGRRGGGEK